jgi:hypothetical protein
MRLSLHIYSSPDLERELYTWNDARGVEFDTGEHGHMSLFAFVPMALNEAYDVYAALPGAWAILAGGPAIVWEGRVEDRAIVEGGINITAFGAWRAMSDVPYTAFWSRSGAADFVKTTSDDASFAEPSRYEMDTNKRVFISPRKGEDFTSGTSIGELYYLVPDGSTRNIAAFSFDYEFNLSSDWTIRVVSRKSDFSSGNVEWSLVGDGTTQSGSVFIQLGTARALLAFSLRPGSAFTTTADTGDEFFKATNIRITTSLINSVQTTTTTTISASSQAVTPASMDNIYVGQRLVIDSEEATSESVIVTAVTSSTFTATFANAYSGTTTIDAIVIYADEIIKDLIDHVSGINENQLSSSRALVESPAVDLFDETYEDEYPADIATRLAFLGDAESPPQQWEVGIWNGRTLHFRPRGDVGAAWSVGLVRHELENTINNLINSVYAVYQDVNRDTVRSSTQADDLSVGRYGITRRQALRVSTTQDTQAEAHRDARLQDGATIHPRSEVVPERVTDDKGEIVEKWMPRSGDTVTIRNLPALAGPEIDRVRTFTVAETRYNVDAGIVELIPEQNLPALDVMIARVNEGIRG